MKDLPQPYKKKPEPEVPPRKPLPKTDREVSEEVADMIKNINMMQNAFESKTNPQYPTAGFMKEVVLSRFLGYEEVDQHE